MDFTSLFRKSSICTYQVFLKSDEQNPYPKQNWDLWGQFLLFFTFDPWRPSWISKNIKKSYKNLFMVSRSMPLPVFVKIWWTESITRSEKWWGYFLTFHPGGHLGFWKKYKNECKISSKSDKRDPYDKQNVICEVNFCDFFNFDPRRSSWILENIKNYPKSILMVSRSMSLHFFPNPTNRICMSRRKVMQLIFDLSPRRPSWILEKNIRTISEACLLGQVLCLGKLFSKSDEQDLVAKLKCFIKLLQTWIQEPTRNTFL